MTADDAVVAVLDALEVAQVPYIIVGSLASNFHGIPRSTRDADFVVEVPPGNLEHLGSALPPGLTLQRQGSFEAVTGTTRYLIDLAGSPFVCELFVRSDDAHDRERFSRRQRVRTMGRVAFVATAEDMIVTKLRWADAAHRSKDIEDIRTKRSRSASLVRRHQPLQLFGPILDDDEVLAAGPLRAAGFLEHQEPPAVRRDVVGATLAYSNEWFRPTLVAEQEHRQVIRTNPLAKHQPAAIG